MAGGIRKQSNGGGLCLEEMELDRQEQDREQAAEWAVLELDKDKDKDADVWAASGWVRVATVCVPAVVK